MEASVLTARRHSRRNGLSDCLGHAEVTHLRDCRAESPATQAEQNVGSLQIPVDDGVRTGSVQFFQALGNLPQAIHMDIRQPPCETHHRYTYRVYRGGKDYAHLT